MFCCTNVKKLWNVLLDKQNPIRGYYSKNIRIKEAAIFGAAAFFVIASIAFIAWGIFSNSSAKVATRISESLSKNRSYVPLVMVGGGILSGSFLFTSLTLLKTQKLYEATLESKETDNGKEKWDKAKEQPLYIDYDPYSDICYLYRNEVNELVISSRVADKTKFSENSERRISNNNRQIVYGTLSV